MWNYFINLQKNDYSNTILSPTINKSWGIIRLQVERGSCYTYIYIQSYTIEVNAAKQPKLPIKINAYRIINKAPLDQSLTLTH